jgi:hypothetical protein
MELVNSTRMIAGYNMMIDSGGREMLVVVIKGTFQIPAESGGPLRLHEQQLPLMMSDVYFGEPGTSAPRYEADFVPRKQYCDVIINGTAYAPGGRAVSRVKVAAQIGNWSKAFLVLGDRFWEADSVGIAATPPIPFVQMPVSYDRAFGGTDNLDEDPANHGAFMANPVGRGFHAQFVKNKIHGSPLPNTEQIGNEVTWISGDYAPMAFGILGRHWARRVQFAGTYDQTWIDEYCPFLPPDFDERYFQSAPICQQLSKPIGEQIVSLTNLTPDGHRDFLLPHLEAPVHIFTRSNVRHDLVAFADTILIEPDFHRVYMTWRVAWPLRRNMFEVSQVLVGRKGKEWWQIRETAFPIPIKIEPMRARG